MSGEAVWAMEMAGLGYLFGANIEHLYSVVGNLTAVAVVLLGVWVVARWRRDGADPHSSLSTL